MRPYKSKKRPEIALRPYIIKRMSDLDYAQIEVGHPFGAIEVVFISNYLLSSRNIIADSALEVHMIVIRPESGLRNNLKDIEKEASNIIDNRFE